MFARKTANFSRVSILVSLIGSEDPIADSGLRNARPKRLAPPLKRSPKKYAGRK